MGAWQYSAECPACKGDGVFHIRRGRDWLGEPRLLWACDNGCTTTALRGALLALDIDPSCLGDYGTPGGRTALYRMFDARGTLLYIGISNDFGRRWKQHAEAKSWYPQVHRQTVDWRESRDEALAEEAAAIKAESPVHNIQHAQGTQPGLDDWADLDWPSRLRVRADLLGYPKPQGGSAA